jgi:hypothetical protein
VVYERSNITGKQSFIMYISVSHLSPLVEFVLRYIFL